MNDRLEKLKEHLKSPEGKTSMKEYFNKLAKKQQLDEKRYKRFEKWLKTNDFNKLINRLILEHGEEWRVKCFLKGCEVYMNNKLGFVFNYIVNNLETIRVPKLENTFPTEIWFFKGYYFRIMYGQGSIVDIYNSNNFKHLLRA